MSVLLHEDMGAVALLTLNRPNKLNALNYELIGALQEALDQIENDPEVRAVILTGAGERAFSAGADILDVAGSIGQGVDTALREVVGRGQGLTKRIERFPKPIIVAVNGIAYGGGCEVTEAAPLAIAAKSARFAKPEILLGFPPPFGGSQRLPRHVGRKRALELILTGDSIDAERAEEIGIVNAVVEDDALIDTAVQLAERIIRHPATAVSACLAAVTRGLNVSIDEGLAIEGAWFATTVESEGVRDGLAAFIDPSERARRDIV